LLDVNFLLTAKSCVFSNFVFFAF